MKIYNKFLCIAIISVLCMISFAACNNMKLQKLNTPANLEIEGFTLIWNKVEHAGSYAIDIDGDIHNADDNNYDLSDLKIAKTYQIKVMAKSSQTGFSDSDWSEIKPYTVIETAHTHAWSNWTVTTAPTCTETGAETRACSRCGETETCSMPVLGHDGGDWITILEPSCTAEGIKELRCTVCAHVLDTQAIPAPGHAWSNWTVTTAPTCTETGAETRACSRCGETETRSMPALGHNWGNWETLTESTISGYGTVRRECLGCGEYEIKDAVTDLTLNIASTTATVSSGAGDWFRIVLTQDAPYAVIAISGSGILEADLYNEHFDLLLTNNPGAGVLNAGTYYVRLYRNTATSGSVRIFKLSGLLNNNDSTGNTNSSVAWSTIIISAETIFRFSSGTASVFAANDFGIDLLPSNANVRILLQPGTYYVRHPRGSAITRSVIYLSGILNSGQQYSVDGLGSDGRWYRFSTESATVINLTLTAAGSTIAAGLYSAYNLNTSITGGSLTTSSNVSEGFVLPAGSYYICLYTLSGTSGAVQIDDMGAAAEELILNETASSVTLGPDKGKWYRLTITQAMPVSFSYTKTSGSGILNIKVFSADQLNVSISTGGAAALTAGTYFVNFYNSSAVSSATGTVRADGYEVFSEELTLDSTTSNITLNGYQSLWYRFILTEKSLVSVSFTAISA